MLTPLTSIDGGGQAYVQTEALEKVYVSRRGTVTALKDISFELREGEFLGVVGPSGCGKSTLLRCIAGLDSPSHGEIFVRGVPMCGSPKGMGIVFQNDALAEWRTVLKNVILTAELRGTLTAELRCRANELLAMFGLGDFIHRYPWELSGGMRQRVAICRALVEDPSLLLMDEPFGALDAMTRDQLNVELHRISRLRKKTVLFITHSIGEAVFLSNRVVVMSRSPGRIIETVDIDLPYPRRLSIREDAAFTRYVRRIRDVFLSLGILKDN